MTHYKYDTTSLNDIPFSDVAEKYGTNLRRVGSKLFMICPYHDDHHASFCVSTRNGNYGHCFACDKTVGVIQFVMDVNHCSFQEACETLSKDFNVPMIEEEYIPPISRDDKLCKANEFSIKAAFRSPKKKKPNSVQEYLKTVHSAIDRTLLNFKRMKEWEEQELAKRVYIPNDYYAPFISKENSFCKGLGHLFLQEGIDLVTEDYQLGCYDKLGNPDDVMFPSIDVEGRIHNIKIQHYCTDPNNDRFLHSDRDHMFWLGSLLKKEGMFDKDAVFDCTCFFGEHLLAKYPTATVVLVESPKNAVIGRLEISNLLWIAAGNKNNLTPKRLECLRGRHVIVIPDRDAMDEWKRKIDEAKHIATFHFSSFCTDKLKDLGEKGDVADYIISKEWIDPNEFNQLNLLTTNEG